MWFGLYLSTSKCGGSSIGVVVWLAATFSLSLLKSTLLSFLLLLSDKSPSQSSSASAQDVLTKPQSDRNLLNLTT
jgi:hypothetical protein